MKQFLWILVSLLLAPWLTAQELTYKQVDNLPYSTSTDAYAKERCQLDLYYPEGATGFPTVVWFHGGGLTSGNKLVPEELKEKGIAVVAVNYRLLPKASLSDCIDDAAAAVAWTYREIERYGGDRHKIFVSGHSAGGYLTNMIGLDKKWLAKYQVDADSLAALVPYSGHAISHFAYREAKGMKVTQPSIDEFAPLYYVRPDAPPLVIISGDREKELLGRYEETAYLWRMMKVVGHPACDLYELDGYDHGSMANPAHKILLDYVRKLCPDNFYEMNRSQAVTAFVTTTDRRRDFDKEYVGFRYETGKLITASYLANGKALLYVMDPEYTGANAWANAYNSYYAVLDLTTDERSEIQFEGKGLPFSSGNFSQRSVVVGDKAYIGTNPENEQPTIYIYDIPTGHVTKGLSITEGYGFDRITVMYNADQE